jgi:serine/threonine protein kinase
MQRKKEKCIDEYILKEVIGSGQFGKVHRAIHNKTKKAYAIKVVNSG